MKKEFLISVLSLSLLLAAFLAGLIFIRKKVPLGQQAQREKLALDPEEAFSQPRDNGGLITGSLSYPSEGLPPDLQVCAENLATKEINCTEEKIRDEKYIYGLGYQLEVPAGKYFVYALTDWRKGYRAYYSEFVACGLKENCLSHQPLVVQVNPGKTTSSINPWDWHR